MLFFKLLSGFGVKDSSIKMQCFSATGKPFKLLQVFLHNRHQRVLLNGQSSAWAPVLAGVPQGSLLGSLFLLIYINVLSKGILSTAKHFADDTFIFSIVNDITGIFRTGIKE